MLYEMTEDQLSTLLVHCTPTPVMLVGGVNIGASAEENANRAWARLGKVMGFEPMSVRPVQGRGYRFFTATPVEREGKE